MYRVPPGLSPEAYAARDRYLDLIDPKHRSHVTNLFLEAARAGLRKPSEVLARVLRTVKDRETAAADLDDAIKWAGILTTLARPEALDFAAYALAYAALPDSERQRIKSARRLTYVDEYMQAQPVTDSQLTLLRRLGWAGYPAIDNRAQAAALITSLMGKGGRRG